MESLARTANRGSVSTGPYEIDNSLRLEDDNTENLYRALNGSTSTTKFTVSMWFKRTELGASMLLYHRGVAGNEGVFLRTSTQSNDALQVDIGGSSTNSRSYTNLLLRDTSAWYHVVLAVDTTQSTATDRFKLYLNGNLITDFASRNNPAEDFAMEVSSAKHRHGAYNDTDGHGGYCGYIAECHYIDGSQVAQTQFGEFDDDTGIWKPKQYTGSYGTGGYYLDFEASGDLGANAKGDGTDFTLNNITAADQATDTPTNNFATWNALFNATGANDGYLGGLLISESGVQATGISGWDSAVSTIAPSSGKWYAEFAILGGGSHVYTMIGVVQAEQVFKVLRSGGYYIGHSDASGYTQALYGNNGATYPAQDDGGNASRFSAGDLISIALDMDNHKIYWAKDGSWLLSDDPASDNGRALGWTGDTYFGVGQYDNDTGIQANFGGFHVNTVSSGNTDANGYGNFEYAPPSGYYALCTKNLAEYG